MITRASLILTTTLFLGSLGNLGCSGSIFGPGDSSSNNGPTASATAALVCSTEQHSPGPAPMRRLTINEFKASITDVLGVDPTPFMSGMPEDGVVNGFNNNADALTIDDARAEAYQSVAEGVADAVLASNELLNNVTQGCDTNSEECWRDVIRRVGRKLFRRPVIEEGEFNEVEKLIALAQNRDTQKANDGIHFILQGLLQSPRFLFRTEFGEVNEERPDLLKLTGYEIASRLSFMFWRTTPDDALLDAAEAGTLDTAQGVADMATQMLQDPRAYDAMHDFADQWFSLPIYVESTSAEPWLLDAATQEGRMLIDDFVWSETDVLGIYTANYSYINQQLAAHYGVTNITGSEFQKVEFDTNSDRGGLLGTAAFAMATSPYEETSIVLRGKYVRDTIMCDVPPAPPPTLDLDSVAPNERVTAPECSGCHVNMDPIGEGLEKFDILGSVRTTYADDTPVPTSGYVNGIENGDFSSARELGQKVVQAQGTSECVIEHYLRWALGRLLYEQSDSCTIDALQEQFAGSGHNFKDLTVDFVKTDAFRFRIAIE